MKISLERSRQREEHFKMCIKDGICNEVGWIHLIRNRVQWWIVTSAV